MNPIKLATAPVRVVGSVAGAGLRTSARVIGWTLEQATSPTPVRTASSAPASPPVRLVEVPAPIAMPTAARRSAVTEAPATKAAVTTTTSKKAPSKKAAVLAPALGMSEAEVVEKVANPTGEQGAKQSGVEPLLDPATAKAVAKETATLSRAADVDKG